MDKTETKTPERPSHGGEVVVEGYVNFYILLPGALADSHNK